MPSVLHILNGDCTAAVFHQIDQLKGDFIIWRELLSEGPAISNVPSKQFWDIRATYICRTYGESTAGYQRKVLFEVALLNTMNCYDEVVLWFDHDLICQINLLAICKFITAQETYPLRFSLMANSPENTPENFRGFTLENTVSLYENRKALSREAIETASNLWDAYTSHDPRNLIAAFNNNTLDFLPFFNACLDFHLQRFPALSNGLNQTERDLLSLLKEPVENVQTLVKKVLNDTREWWITDLQVHAYLERLRPLINWNGRLQINELGKQTLNKQFNFLDCVVEPIYLGGALNVGFRWDEENGKLIKSLPLSNVQKIT